MIMHNLTSERKSDLGERGERHMASKTRFRILIIADDSRAREALATLLNQEPDFLVCCVVDNADQALKAMDKQHVDCAVVSLSKNHADYSLAEEIELRHPYLALLTIAPDDLFYSKNASRKTIGGHVMGQEAAKRITGAANYVQTLLGSHIHGFAISSKLGRSVTHGLGLKNS